MDAHTPLLAVQAMRDIVAKCLMKDPSRRPTAAQLLEHKFFKVRCHGVWACAAILCCLGLMAALSEEGTDHVHIMGRKITCAQFYSLNPCGLGG